jgi:hypothetical protein
MLSPQQGHIDVGLTNISVMYRPAGFVADQVFQMLPSQKQSDKYWAYGLDNLRATDDERRPAALSNQLEMTLAPAGPYYCDGHALHDWVPDETAAGVDAPIDPQIDATMALTDVITLNKEIALVNLLSSGMTPIDLSASTYANAWDNSTGIDPITQIDKAKETIQLLTGKKPNKLLLSRPVWRGTRNNPTVKGRVSGALEGIDKTLITAAQFAATCELDEVIIGEAINVTSKPGQAVTSSYVWGKYALLFYQPPSPGLRTIALGYEFRWMAGQLGSVVYTDHSTRRHATWIEAHQYYAQQMIVPAAGVLWSNTTQN